MHTELKLSDAAKMLVAEAKDQLVLNERQLAVVAAAKDWADAPLGRVRLALSRLRIAIEALQAAEEQGHSETAAKPPALDELLGKIGKGRE